MMKKTLHRSVLAALVVASMTAGAYAAPVVVTPGSNAGYLYFPSAGKSSTSLNEPGMASVGVDAMQVATTQCYTSSGTVTLPDGFEQGYIQAIVVAGGSGRFRTMSSHPGSNMAGGASSISHAAIGTVTAQPGGGSGGGGVGRNGPWDWSGHAGGGGGGYLGIGGAGYGRGGGGGGGGGSGGAGTTADASSPAPVGGSGQGVGFGGAPGDGGTLGGKHGAAGTVLQAPMAIMCPNPPTASHGLAKGGTGFGAGAGGLDADSGGDAGGVAAVVWKYTPGAITVVVGSGGSGNAGQGAPGVVAIRFIPQ